MNYQANSGLPSITKEDAAKLMGEKYPDDFEYLAWPETFGSTAGPFGGIGGQAMTTFTMEAWVGMDVVLVFCGGRRVRIVERHQFVVTTPTWNR